MSTFEFTNKVFVWPREGGWLEGGLILKINVDAFGIIYLF